MKSNEATVSPTPPFTLPSPPPQARIPLISQTWSLCHPVSRCGPAAGHESLFLALCEAEPCVMRLGTDARERLVVSVEGVGEGDLCRLRKGKKRS